MYLKSIEVQALSPLRIKFYLSSTMESPEL